MSFAPLSIEHAGGVRQVLAYTLPRVEERRELQAVITRGSAEYTILGDAGARPEAFTVEAEVPGATLGAALALAYTIVGEAETATVARTHWGDVPVAGLLGFRVEARSASSARLVLEFAPAGVVQDLVPFTVDSLWVEL